MVEAQAAARVDRLDQTKDVVIIRYVVDNSIEQVSAMTKSPTHCILRLMSWLEDPSKTEE